MAQPFVSRLPLIEGHGNFGSVDGDPAAAMRYTECRLSEFCQDVLLKDLHTAACSYRANFDATEVEPTCLPARLPLLLLQGTSGVAVGLSTHLPPHNLNEILDACIALIDNPRLSDSSLYRLLPGPDFPTGGVLLLRDAQQAAGYRKGVWGCTWVRDESDYSGVRVVFELEAEVSPQQAWSYLLSRTALEVSVHCNLVALKEGKHPQRMSIREVIENWIQFRLTAVKARLSEQLEQLQQQQEKLEAAVKAAKYSREVAELLQRSRDAAEAIKEMQGPPFLLTEGQAASLLRMRLSSLLQLEQQQQQQQLQQVQQQQQHVQQLLQEPQQMLQLIKKELQEIKNKYSCPRRTLFLLNKTQKGDSLSALAALTHLEREEETQKETGDTTRKGDKVAAVSFVPPSADPEGDCLLLLTKRAYGKRLSLNQLRIQRRGGLGAAVIRISPPSPLFSPNTQNIPLEGALGGPQGKGPQERGPQGGPHEEGPQGGPHEEVPQGGPHEEGPQGAPHEEGPQGGPQGGGPHEEGLQEGGPQGEGLQEGGPHRAPSEGDAKRGGKGEGEGSRDEVCCLAFVGPHKDVGIVSEAGIVSRRSVSSVPLYSSKLARGVLLHKLRKRSTAAAADAAAAVVLLPEQHTQTENSSNTVPDPSPTDSTAAAAAAAAANAAAAAGQGG
ncbi:DNA gyrase subunit A, putative, partial [Eimeria acervulina]